MSLIFTRNIRELLSEKDLTIAEFADAIGEKVSRINDVLSGKQRPPFDIVEKILTTFDVDARWLITGKNNSRIEPADIRNYSESLDYDYVPMFDVEVSAGNGAAAYGVTDPAMHLAFRKDWLKSRGLFAKDLNCVVARGDSMEPTINSKDTLLVDTSKNNPRDGQIYVIRSGDTLWVKRIQKQLDGSLLLISDNDTYPPMSLTLADHPDIQVIGQVVQISKDLS
ncbi:transcriptional regulator [Neisseria flavescens]|uniref:LexA family transcriptional regulator n=1 Tax=Neisseria flavescens TaxID=484 RepID=UPI0007A8534E|nr:S24 family peptidase [Neisseria flavescens]KZC80504.1 transcriptional regulator [Neisseria flavescens]